MRVQEAVRQIFARFRELGSGRQVLLALAEEQSCFPRPSDGRTMVSFDWTPIRYRNVMSVLKNPFFAGAYAYGKTERRTEIVDGRVRKSYGSRKPMQEWEVLLKDHHEGYIDWAEFERNQTLIATNAYGKAGGTKSGRGGRALLAGLLTCGRCGRKLMVLYSGRSPGRLTYRCDRRRSELGIERCFAFGGVSVDAAIAEEILRVVEPMAIEASSEAERMHMQHQRERQRVVEQSRQRRHEGCARRNPRSAPAGCGVARPRAIARPRRQCASCLAGCDLARPWPGLLRCGTGGWPHRSRSGPQAGCDPDRPWHGAACAAGARHSCNCRARAGPGVAGRRYRSSGWSRCERP